MGIVRARLQMSICPPNRLIYEVAIILKEAVRPYFLGWVDLEFRQQNARADVHTGGIGFQVPSNQVADFSKSISAPKYRTEAHRTSK